MGLGWKSAFRSGKGGDTITSGIEGAWTANPTKWDTGYFDLLFGYKWELVKSPAGAHQWKPIGAIEEHMAPAAADATKKVSIMMTTADMAMIVDPAYRSISERFHKDPKAFADAFSRAWFKLLHRDMGPKSRYLCPDVPSEDFIWQDPVPVGNSNYDIDALKITIRESGLSIKEMVETAWASASTYRKTDMRGGANGARIRLLPQRNWEANNPNQLARVLAILQDAAKLHGASLADTIVLAGNVAIEAASGATVPFSPGRGDATQEMTDVESFGVLEPVADGFRNYLKTNFTVSPEEMMLDRAHLLGLTAPQMTVLLGGLRSLGVSSDGRGLFTASSEGLNPGFFTVLLDMSVQWKQVGSNAYEAVDSATGKVVRNASRCDLVFGSNSQLRAIAEVYAQDDSRKKFVQDFLSAWVKVMDADRHDLHSCSFRQEKISYKSKL